MDNKKETIGPIAIVGLGCRYPSSGVGPDSFWEMLSKGGDAVRDIPADRWNIDRFYDPDGKTPGTMRVRQGAFLDQPIDQFDAGFYGISPRDAERIDPQQRLLLEVVWEAFEDAGIPPSLLSDTPAGVYAGGFTLDYYVNQLSPYSREVINQHTALGSTLVMLSNRLSYLFNLHGPSLTIDTACSSSLVAFHYACQDLWSGKTNMAVVCGVNVMLRPELTMVMSAGKFLSSDSRSKAFDRSADGYGRGEGAGAIILKPLEKALEDGDSIYSVVKATGVNQDGRTSGIASPNGEAQERLIRQVLRDAAVDPEDIVLIEAHGTGTAVGDTTEVSALARAFGANKSSAQRYIGSVKANIAHQEAGAGIAGIIKTTLCLKHGKVPPQIHVKELNPEIPFDDYQFRVARKLEELPKRGASSHLACVNSFGYGGTNAHAILENYDGDSSSAAEVQGKDAHILCLSTRSDKALSELSENYRNWLAEKDEASVHNACFTATNRRDHHPHRLAVVAATGDDLRQGLEGSSASNILLARSSSENDFQQNMVWVFTGMGPQWWAMGQQLYQQQAVFRQNMQEAATAFADHAGWSILDEMLKPEASSNMTSNAIAQPANFILQAALVAQWKDWGIKPAAIVGHSIGEVGAALAAGALDLDQAAQVAFHRSRLQQTMAGKGRLLAAGIDADFAAEICKIYPDEISIAAINSPASCALAGEESVLNEIAGGLDEKGIFNRLVMGEIAYHSHQMMPLQDELKAALRSIVPNKPEVPLYSCVTGQRVNSAIHDAEYWWNNVRQPVLFKKAMDALLDDGYSTFLEIGPHPVLSGVIRECASAKEVKPHVFASMARKTNEKRQLLETLAGFYVNGINPNWSKVYEKGSHISLPTYPWQREYHWAESSGAKQVRLEEIDHPLLGVAGDSPQPEWMATIPNQGFPQIIDHVVDGQSVFPAAGYLEAFIAAASNLLVGAKFSLENLSFISLLAMPRDKHLYLKTSTADKKNLRIHARSIGQDTTWSLHAEARVVEVPYKSQAVGFETAVVAEQGTVLHRQDVYQKLRARGLEYGPAFQSIEQASIQGGTVYADLSLPDAIEQNPEFKLHPILVDGCLQLLALLGSEQAPAVPVGIERVIFFAALPDKIRCQAKITSKSKVSLLADVLITDLKGRLLARLMGVHAKVLPASSSNSQNIKALLHQWRWGKMEIIPDQKDRVPAFVWHAKNTADDQLGMQASLDLLEQVKLQAKQPCRMIVVTQNAQQVSQDDCVLAQASAIWGAARVARAEYPDLAIALVDCDIGENCSIDLETLPALGEFAIRENLVYEHKLEANENLDAFVSPPVALAGVQLDVGKKGLLSSLNYRKFRRVAPQHNEVEIRFLYASINFKDVLKALGKLDESVVEGTFFADAMGMEAAGIIHRVGSGIRDYKVGDRVVCCAADGCFKTYSTVQPELTPMLKWSDMHRPDEIAGIPIAFITAELALVDIARLGAGDTVLLHSASGGVGQAAIQVAKRLGANILATAGSDEKRELIKSMGVDAVYDSRSLDFVDEVLLATKGRGVDVALNFLSGDSQESTLSVMAPFGRMVEIGKSDISENRGLSLSAFQENLQFSSVDIDRLVAQRFDTFMALFRRVRDYFDQGVYQPIPTEIVPTDQVESAFRKMIEATHTGKLSLDLTEQSTQQLPSFGERFDIETMISSNASYVITGGFGGLGLRSAVWLANKGARYLVLAGRRGATSDIAKDTIESLRKRGISITEAKADVSSEKDVTKLLGGWEKGTPEVRGLLHCAGVLSDAMIENLNRDAFEPVFSSKVESARLLHEKSQALALNLDLFVLFSSVSSVVGNPGQANYAAANAYLDGLALYRRSQGLPALSISLGAISEVGMAASNSSVETLLASMGIKQNSPEEALQALEVCLLSGAAGTGIFSVDWNQWGQRNPQAINTLPFKDFVLDSQLGAREHEYNLPDLSQLSEKDGIDALSTILLEEAANVLRLDVDKMSARDSFSSLGMDSLMSVEFTVAVQERFGIRLGSADVSPSMSAKHMASNLYGKLLSSVSDEAESSNLPVNIDVDIDALSDEEVEKMLGQFTDEGMPRLEA